MDFVCRANLIYPYFKDRGMLRDIFIRASFPAHRFLTFLCTMQPVPRLTIEIRIKFLTFSVCF